MCPNFIKSVIKYENKFILIFEIDAGKYMKYKVIKKISHTLLFKFII